MLTALIIFDVIRTLAALAVLIRFAIWLRRGRRPKLPDS